MKKELGTVGSWLLILFLFPIAPAVSIFLILRKIFLYQEEKRENREPLRSDTGRSTAKPESTTRKKRPKTDAFVEKLTRRRTARMIFGVLLAFIGGCCLIDLYDIYELFNALVYLVPSAFFFFRSYQLSEQIALYRRCLAIIGSDKAIEIKELAAVTGMAEEKLTAKIEQLLGLGALPAAYIDHSRGLLVLSADRIEENELWQKASPQPEAPIPADAAAGNEREEYLHRIRKVNDEIADEALSQKIARIEELVSKMFEAVERDPQKQPELDRFLSYYLPTTLRILNAYRDFENGTAQGEKIRSTMRDIEASIDTLVTGFERQLDFLYENDTLDIEADLRVLEGMLAKDGLTDEGSIASVCNGASEE